MKRIKEELELLGIKQSFVAKKVGVSEPVLSTLIKYETTYDKIRKFLKQIKGIK